MNLLEQELHYPLDHALPAVDEALEVAPGVLWARMGLPFALDHINVWLLRDVIDGVAGWTVVDCCIDRPESRAQWQTLFASALQGLPVLRVIVTHMHPDHLGLAHWLCAHWNAPLWISATDFNAARISVQSSVGYGGESAAEFYATHGISDPHALQQIRERGHYYRNLVPALPRQMHRLMDGRVLRIGNRNWHCISGYGHAPEHIALHCPELNVLISGDMILPRITTNVSVFEIEPESNPLQLFLDSLQRYLPLPQNTLVLPSHGRPFTGLHRRIAQLQEHHTERLAEVMTACSEHPCSATDAMAVLFKRPLDLHQTTFALGESLAHLHALWMQGQLTRYRDAQGVYRFSANAELTRP